MVALGVSAPTPEEWQVIFAACQAVLGVGVGVFAWLEWRIHREEVHDRKRVAAHALISEATRLQGLRFRLQDADLVQLMRDDVFDLEILRPRDWGLVVQYLGELGVVSAMLGGMAYAEVDAVVQNAQALARAVRAGRPDAALRALEEKVKRGVVDVALGFADAMKHAPKELFTESAVLGEVESDMGKRIKAAVDQILKSQGPT